MGRIFEKRKHKIFARNAKLSKLFTRIGKEIAMAVKAGGPNPDANTRLRMAMAQLWHRDLRLYERLKGGVQTARSLDELLKVLDTEAELQKLFQVYNYTSAGFLSMMNSISRAETLRESGVRADSIPSIDFMNYNFVTSNSVWLSLMRGRIYKAEGGLSIWH